MKFCNPSSKAYDSEIWFCNFGSLIDVLDVVESFILEEFLFLIVDKGPCKVISEGFEFDFWKVLIVGDLSVLESFILEKFTEVFLDLSPTDYHHYFTKREIYHHSRIEFILFNFNIFFFLLLPFNMPFIEFIWSDFHIFVFFVGIIGTEGAFRELSLHLLSFIFNNLSLFLVLPLLRLCHNVFSLNSRVLANIWRKSTIS